MSGNYPELKRAEALIKETLKMEEENSSSTWTRYENFRWRNNQDRQSSSRRRLLNFMTLMLPLDLTQDILKNKSLQIDSKKFDDLMKKSRELGKKKLKGSETVL